MNLKANLLILGEKNALVTMEKIQDTKYFIAHQEQKPAYCSQPSELSNSLNPQVQVVIQKAYCYQGIASQDAAIELFLQEVPANTEE